MALQQGSIAVESYETKFHISSKYAIELVTIEEERIRLFVEDLNPELQALFVHMIIVGKSFNKMTIL